MKIPSALPAPAHAQQAAGPRETRGSLSDRTPTEGLPQEAGPFLERPGSVPSPSTGMLSTLQTMIEELLQLRLATRTGSSVASDHSPRGSQ